MKQLRALFARVAGLFAGSRADDDLRAELESHLEMETAENIRRGMAPEEARRQALLASGGMVQAAEAVRDRRGLPWIESAVADLRYATRSLRHTPAFTAVVVITLALGIGANTAIFSVVRAVLLKPLPHRDGDRLVYLRQSSDGPTGSNVKFSVPEVSDYRTGAPALGGIAEYSPWFGTLLEDDGASSLDVGLVTGNFFEIMGLAPVLGRMTGPADDGAGVPPVAVLTHDYWIKHFGADSAIVGKQLRLNGQSVTVIGVMQPAPYFPDRVSLFTNMVLSQHHLSAQMVLNRSHRMTEMIARLAPGATLAQARSQVAAIHTREMAEFKEAYDPRAHYSVSVIPFKQVMGERAQTTLWLLMGAAAFVLIISAANVVNLTLMRGVRREHELVVRAALGAGASRLRRLLLAENLVLALLGGALGVLIAMASVGMLAAVADRYSPRADEIRLDAAVLAFTFVVSLGLALLLSVLASLPREGSFASWISAGGQRLSASLSKHRLQRALVALQVAVSVVLLAGAGLLTRTMIQVSDISTGLRTEEVLTIPLALVNPAQLSPAADALAKQGYEQIRGELRALPGVVEVGVGSTMPLQKGIMTFEIEAEGQPAPAGGEVPKADMRTASPEYFRASGIPLLKGREFDATDRFGSGRVVIINQTLADRFFPGRDPLGMRIALRSPILRLTPFSGDWRTIVGVVGNTQDGGLESGPSAAVFSPFAQEMAVFGGLVVRADTNAESLAVPATRIIKRYAPNVPLENVLTIAQIRAIGIAPHRLNAQLISSFGILAVIIAAVGIAGVLGFSVSARTGEIGIRMSLGADGGRVQRMILKEGGALVLIGLAAGVIGAFFATRAMRGMLFGVSPDDPATFAVVALLMGAIGMVACWIPALRAARVNPVTAMRSA